jgi:hypothetical protein
MACTPLQELIEKLGPEKSQEILEGYVEKTRLEVVKRRVLPAVDEEPLPKDLVLDWKTVFKGANIPGMNGWRARTLKGRVDIIREIIYNKLAFDQDYNLCPCGCGYVNGCGTP